MMHKISYVLFIIFFISSLMAMEDECSHSHGATSSLSNFSSQPEEFIQIDEILRKEREAVSRYYNISMERKECQGQDMGDVSYKNISYLPCFLCFPCCCPCLLIACGIRHCCPSCPNLCGCGDANICGAEDDRLKKEMEFLHVEAENYDKEAKNLMMDTYVRTGQKHPEMYRPQLKLEKHCRTNVIVCSIQ